MAAQESSKRLAISKANAQMITVVAISAFVSVFCLVASRTIFEQNLYQNKVINAKNKVNKTLKSNIASANTLVNHYKLFVGQSPNVIGGNPTGSGDKDGDNGTLILDALPDKYDFPALTSSIEKIVNDNGLVVSSLTGIDDQLNQENSESPTPQPVSMPFELTVDNASYQGIQNLVKAFQSSIRPMVVDKLEISGGGSKMQVVISAHTYYQPAKNLTITKQVVK